MAPTLGAASGQVLERLHRVGALGRGAVCEEEKILRARVPELQDRPRLHDENASPLEHVPLGWLAEVDVWQPGPAPSSWSRGVGSPRVRVRARGREMDSAQALPSGHQNPD
jgi:hypothetical protein